MIYFCADDYGLCTRSSERILECIDNGVLNKISVFPNMGQPDLEELLKRDGVLISLHLNLVEGKCMADPDGLSLLVDKNGNLKNTFGGLFGLWLFKRKQFEAQVYKEIKAQVLFFKDIMPDGVKFGIDSHQHVHMIPSVFKAMMTVLNDEKIDVEYLRIPTEPLLPFLKTPSLYFTYSAVNIIKQWLLNLLWLTNKRLLKGCSVKTAKFFGILFSGKMDRKRVERILPKYVEFAEKSNSDIEVLFHPGYISKSESDFTDKNIVFEKFYFSENRKTEHDSVMEL